MLRNPEDTIKRTVYMIHCKAKALNSYVEKFGVVAKYEILHELQLIGEYATDLSMLISVADLNDCEHEE